MSFDKNVPPFVAHFDGNQVPSIVGVVGTLGTTDQGGTAKVLPIGVNPATGAMYVHDLSGASGTTNVNVTGTPSFIDVNEVGNNQFKMIAKDVLYAPQTTSGNHTMAWDKSNTTYFLSVGSPNSQLYSYNYTTGAYGTVADGTTIEQTYPGAALTYANGSLYFTRGGGFSTFYRIGTGGGALTNLTNSPSSVNFGADMVYDGDDYVYMVSAAPGFQRFSIGSNSWGSLAVVPFTGAEGLSLSFIGTDRLASLQGAGGTNFAIYNITTGTWANKAGFPATTYDGAALAWGGGNYLYAFRGIGARDFYKYEVTANRWFRQPDLPIPASTASTFLSKDDGSFLAYIAEPSGITDFGIVNNLYVYDPSRLNVVNSGIPIGGVNRAGELNTGNPVVLAGTNTDGTVVGLRIDSAGIPEVYAVGGGGVKLQQKASTFENLTWINGGTINSLAAGTFNTLGTVGTIPGIGTLTNLGSVTNLGSQTDLAKLYSGTINVGTFVQPSGTITTIAAGTQNTLGTVGTIPGIGSLTNLGSLTNIGTLIGAGVVTTVTTVSNLTNGSVRMTVGTLTTGTLQNLVTGTINALAAGTLTGGTLQNLVSGTINALAAGTLTGGTLGNLNYGTVAVDAKPAGSTILTIHTLGTGGGTFVGTMVAPVGAGTYIYLTGISIVARSGGSIDVGLANNVAGTTGAGVIARGFFPTAGGGIRQEFNPALRVGTNGTLAYFLVTAGTADFTAQYWVGP